MYVTHGDMIIFRPERQQRHGPSARLRPHSERYTERGDRGRERWDGLREWVAELEERVSRLETRLQRVGAGGDVVARPGDRSGWPGEAPARRRESGDWAAGVRVSLQAGSGAQVTLGEVRVINRD